MSEQRIPEPLQPTPEPLDEGWHNVATVGDTAIDVHDKRTVVASVVASAATTLLYLATQERVPMGVNFDLSSDTSHTVVDKVETKHTHDDDQWVMTSQKRMNEQMVPVTTRKAESVQVVMPDVTHFDLGKEPSARRILNPDQVDHLFGILKADQQDGWKITGAHVEGMASDEFSKAPNAGIGTQEPANQKLAGQYGAFVKTAVVDSLQSDGAVIPTTMEAHEVPIDVRGQAWIAGASKELGLTTKQLIEQYKKDPASLKAEVRARLDVQLGANRGGKVTFDLERTTVAEQAEYLAEDVTRCVDITRTVITTKEVTDHSEALLPIGLVPFPVLRSRRKKVLEGEVVEPEEDAEPAGLALGDGVVRAGKYPREYDLPRTFTEEDLRASTERLARNYEYRQLAKRAGTIAGIVAVGALVSGIRLDAGYCPDPSKYQEQPYDISKGPFPDSVHVHWELPFTDIRTGDALLIPSNCEPQHIDPMTGEALAPDCDVIDETVRDGKVVAHDETNYPGALHTRTYTVK